MLQFYHWKWIQIQEIALIPKTEKIEESEILIREESGVGMGGL